LKLLALGAAVTPFEDTFHGNPLYGYYDEVKEKKRQAVNEWIPLIPSTFCRHTIRAITFTRKIPATRRWPTQLT
jgi:hypothetical protein